MKIGLAQINPTVGDLDANRARIVDFAVTAASKGAGLVVFPELCVTGYPPLDLLENRTFMSQVAETIDKIAEKVPEDIGVLIGAPLPNPSRTGKKLINAALLLNKGVISSIIGKRLLPSYDVFDEARYFEPSSFQQVVTFNGIRLGIHICEDMWNVEGFSEDQVYNSDPLADLHSAGIDLYVNLSASPFSIGKHDLRTRVIRTICDRFETPFVLVNQVGANTEVLFDGDSRVHAGDGALVACAPSFEESLLVWDFSQPTRHRGAHSGVTREARQPVREMHDALVMGIRDYFGKTGAFSKALVGLSGGIDSAVTCALAVEALGAERVVGITMPSKYSSAGSVDDSFALSENLGIPCDTISIRAAVDVFSDLLSRLFADTRVGTAEENIQARIRGNILMAVSNKFDYLLLTTGNKSELAVGYATLYGDMSGGLAVLSDVFKTQVYELARYINHLAGTSVIPESTITKAPSAELAPDQKDEDSLPPYPVLDEILQRYIERREDIDEITDRTRFDRNLVLSVLSSVDRNEYKRRQAAPGLRVSGKAFGMGRRLPIVQKYQRPARKSNT